MTSTKLNLSLAIFLLVCVAAAIPQRYTFTPETSTMTVSGTSTIHDWDCPVETVDGWVETAAEDASIPVSGEVTVPVTAIECGKRVMNRKLRDALRSKDHPNVTFRTESIRTDGDAWIASGMLAIAGTELEMEVPIASSRSGESFRFQGEIELSLETLGVERPTAVMGTIKTGDIITVSFDVTAGS